MDEAEVNRLRELREEMESDRTEYDSKASRCDGVSFPSAAAYKMYNSMSQSLGKYIDKLDELFPELKE